MEVNNDEFESLDINSEEDSEEYEDDYEDYDDLNMDYETNKINKDSESELDNTDWKFMPQVLQS